MRPTNVTTLPLRTILITLSVPEAVLADFRASFPEIRFVVPEVEPSDAVRDAPAKPATADDVLAADAIIGWDVPADMLAASPRLRWIHSGGAGVGHFDLTAIAERGVVLTNASGVSAPNMAEHVLGMMIALARRFPQLVQAQARRTWRDFETHPEVRELRGQTILIVGVGDIGREVATRAAAFGMRVNGLRRRTGERLPPGFDAMYGTAALHQALPTPIRWSSPCRRPRSPAGSSTRRHSRR